ncbi:MAG: TIGR00725 family protein [Actinobacteria bacterium]|nr:MAG: TIGR00725 family protein [Actinomycetota bacterium]
MRALVRPYIGVIGPDPCDEVVGERCERIGRLLAEAGAVLVCGGLGGSMERAARGAFEAGGFTLGILPGTTRAEGNPYLTLSVPTGMGEMRNALNVRASDAVIAVAGEYGTLSEIAFALKTGVPVVGLGTWVLSKEARAGPDAIARVSTPEEAVASALRLAGYS